MNDTGLVTREEVRIKEGAFCALIFFTKRHYIKLQFLKIKQNQEDKIRFPRAVS